VARQRKQFDILLERMREVNLGSDYSKSSAEVVDPAVVPVAPIRPNKPRMVWMSVFLGLFAGIGLAFFFEHMDDTVKTPDDMEDRVGVPVLGFVPDMAGHNGAVDAFSYRGRVSLVEPKSSVTEAYRNIRTSLYFFAAPPEDMKVLVITSAGPGEGKTTTASNLALVIAQSGKRVLLVDADFRRPMIHKVFGFDAKLGLSTVLAGASGLDESVQKLAHDGKVVEHLDILVGGPRPQNPAELLGSEGMKRFLDEARRKYDRIIIDTPPVLFVADATIASAASDGVILIVKAAKKSRSVAIKARERLEGVKARVLGGILNDVFVSRLGYYYSYYYQHYPYSRYYRDYYHSYYPHDKDGEAESKPQGSDRSA
jgi:capsular exopolysaccharide synthesis family protein